MPRHQKHPSTATSRWPGAARGRSTSRATAEGVAASRSSGRTRPPACRCRASWPGRSACWRRASRAPPTRGSPRRLRRVVRGGVVWLERRGTGTPWLVLHGVAGLFCSAVRRPGAGARRDQAAARAAAPEPRRRHGLRGGQQPLDRRLRVIDRRRARRARRPPRGEHRDVGGSGVDAARSSSESDLCGSGGVRALRRRRVAAVLRAAALRREDSPAAALAPRGGPGAVLVRARSSRFSIRATGGDCGCAICAHVLL